MESEKTSERTAGSVSYRDPGCMAPGRDERKTGKSDFSESAIQNERNICKNHESSNYRFYTTLNMIEVPILGKPAKI